MLPSSGFSWKAPVAVCLRGTPTFFHKLTTTPTVSSRRKCSLPDILFQKRERVSFLFALQGVMSRKVWFLLSSGHVSLSSLAFSDLSSYLTGNLSTGITVSFSIPVRPPQFQWTSYLLDFSYNMTTPWSFYFVLFLSLGIIFMENLLFYLLFSAVHY